MFEIYPEPSVHFTCPACKQPDISPEKIVWQGMHVLADCRCRQCQLSFYHTCPTGHALLFPTAFAQETHHIFPSPDTGPWFYQPLFDSYYSNDRIDVPIQIIEYRRFETVVILNCLDSVYGHALLRLLNTQLHLSATPLIGVVVLVPQSLQWLVPEGVAEVWAVDVSFADTRKWLRNLDNFVQRQLLRFHKVFVSHAKVHPDWNTIDISLFTRIYPFPISAFATTPQQITFLWREDRFWMQHAWEEWLFKFSIKTGTQKSFRWFFLLRQKQLFTKMARIIRRQIPKVRFSVTGLGNSGHLPSLLQDKRCANPTVAIEKEWCALYSQSHLVIGIHGSNMLLPSALAAGFIELLPSFRLANFGEAIATRYPDRRQLFLGRFLPVLSSPAHVAAHAIHILTGFAIFQRLLADTIKSDLSDVGTE